MPPPDYFFLTERDRREIIELLEERRNRRQNPTNRPHQAELATSPAIFVARAPQFYGTATASQSGIPALVAGSTGTGSDSGDEPGYADCDVYMIVWNDAGVPRLHAVTGGVKRVFNLYSSDIQGGTWVVVNKDGYGNWYANPGANVSPFSGCPTNCCRVVKMYGRICFSTGTTGAMEQEWCYVCFPSGEVISCGVDLVPNCTTANIPCDPASSNCECQPSTNPKTYASFTISGVGGSVSNGPCGVLNGSQVCASFNKNYCLVYGVSFGIGSIPYCHYGQLDTSVPGYLTASLIKQGCIWYLQLTSSSCDSTYLYSYANTVPCVAGGTVTFARVLNTTVDPGCDGMPDTIDVTFSNTDCRAPGGAQAETGCLACNVNTYNFVGLGFSDLTCSSCSEFNATLTLTDTGDHCHFTGSTAGFVTCGMTVTQGLLSLVDNGSTGYELTLTFPDLSTTTYFLPYASWSCTGTNTMLKQTSSSGCQSPSTVDVVKTS